MFDGRRLDEELTRLEERKRELLRQLSDMENEANKVKVAIEVMERLKPRSEQPTAQVPPSTPDHLSRKARADLDRRSYASVLEREGIRLGLAGGRWAKTADGSWVLVLVSAENKPSEWWFGLPKDLRGRQPVATVLLVRQSLSELIVDIVLDGEFVDGIVEELTSAKEFVVKKVGGRYQLQVPYKGERDISNYVGARSPLR